MATSRILLVHWGPGTGTGQVFILEAAVGQGETQSSEQTCLKGPEVKSPENSNRKPFQLFHALLKHHANRLHHTCPSGKTLLCLETYMACKPYLEAHDRNYTADPRP